MVQQLLMQPCATGDGQAAGWLVACSWRDKERTPIGCGTGCLPARREILTRELESVGIRLNRKPPNIYFRRKKTGGVQITSLVPLTKMDEKLAARICAVRGLWGAGGWARGLCRHGALWSGGPSEAQQAAAIGKGANSGVDGRLLSPALSLSQA